MSLMSVMLDGPAPPGGLPAFGFSPETTIYIALALMLVLAVFAWKEPKKRKPLLLALPIVWVLIPGSLLTYGYFVYGLYFAWVIFTLAMLIIDIIAAVIFIKTRY